ncbi:Mobile element protein [Pseudoalteromonas arctica]|uniref:Mobile element protein n=1 Tax=Pseudoalteromonas arctica TaxID=394751 RepID=A0AAP6Y5M5_9GAMM|nr:Mobile element protein [Pseudoalteromonas arctica]
MRYLFWAKAPLIDQDSWQQGAKGKPYNTIIRSLAFKRIRILFRCWKAHSPTMNQLT